MIECVMRDGWRLDDGSLILTGGRRIMRESDTIAFSPLPRKSPNRVGPKEQMFNLHKQLHLLASWLSAIQSPLHIIAGSPAPSLEIGSGYITGQLFEAAPSPEMLLFLQLLVICHLRD